MSSNNEALGGDGAAAPLPSGAAQSALDAEESRVARKVGTRLMWFLMALYFCSIMDRGNVSFAALTMNREIGLSAQMFGIGVGVMFVTYSLFELPSNLLLARIGARATLTRIAILWGLATMLMACASGPTSFYLLRGVLGLAEAGLFPGVMLYMSYWFPYRYRARYNAMFNFAVPVSYVVSSILSGSILAMDGIAGLSGWRWLFLLEGLPSIALGVVGLFYLTNQPAEARWLSAAERSVLAQALARDAAARVTVHEHGLWRALKNPVVLTLGLCNTALFFGLTSLSYWLPQIIHGFALPHVGYASIGVLTALPPLGGLLGMIVLSRWSDRAGSRFVHTALAYLIAALGFSIVAALPGSLPAIIIGFVIANIGVYSTQAIFWTIPQSFLHRSMAAGATGLIGMMGSIGGAVMPALAGRLKDLTHSFSPAFLVVAAVSVAASLTMVLLGRRLGKQRLLAR